MNTLKRPYQCGLCAEWTERGEHLPSGNWNPRTRQTPLDNFVCSKCQREKRDLASVNPACDRYFAARAA